MYPRGALAELADRKALLQARIAVRRYELMVAGAESVKPLALVDRGIAAWQKFSPAVKGLGIPLLLMLWRFIRRKKGKGTAAATGFLNLAALLKTLPFLLRGWRAMSRARAGAKTQESES